MVAVYLKNGPNTSTESLSIIIMGFRVTCVANANTTSNLKFVYPYIYLWFY